MATPAVIDPTTQEKPAELNSSAGVEASTPKSIVTLDSNGEHLLQSPWTFWFARKIPKTQHPTPVNYAEHLQKIASFNTVESFYRTYVYIARPQELPKDSNFHMFKGDAVPMWESFPNGGCWIIKINKKHPQLALIWEELLVYAIGETFEEPDIVGVVLSIRAKEYIIQVWNSDSQNSVLRNRVCEKLKYYLRLDPITPLEYKPNSLSLRSNDKVSHRPNGKVAAPVKDKKKKKKNNKQQQQQQTTNAPAPAQSTTSTPTPAPAPAPAQPTTPATSTPPSTA